MNGGQLTLVPDSKLPFRPEELVDIDPPARGQLYNDADLDSWQRGCVEEARRRVLAGTYPTGRAT